MDKVMVSRMRGGLVRPLALAIAAGAALAVCGVLTVAVTLAADGAAAAQSPCGEGSTDPAAQTRTLTLLFHGGVQGKILDCGCKAKPLGGLARRAALIEKVRGASKENSVVLVDAGGLFGEDSPQMRAQTDLLIHETAKLGYQAIGVGASDLGLGVDYLERARAVGGLPFTSANLTRGGQPLLAPYLVLQSGGTRVGVICVLGTSARPAPGQAAGEAVAIGDPAEALQRYLPELRAKSDLIVLLSQLPAEGLTRLLTTLGSQSGIAVAVDGTSYQPTRTPRQVACTTVLSANSQGKYLGEATLTLAGAALAGTPSTTVHELTLDLPENPQIASRVHAFVEQQKVVAASH
jgi:2',3'-cyclic-nucleotide 2'-phosphodiesterase (5'-nucleotidase family)